MQSILNVPDPGKVMNLCKSRNAQTRTPFKMLVLNSLKHSVILMLDFCNIDGVAFDGDGTLWRGEEPLPGLRELNAFAQSHSVRFVVVTNNSTRTPRHFQHKLQRFGLSIESSQIITCAMVAAHYLQQHCPPASPVYVIGEEGLHSAVEEAGFQIVHNATSRAKAVVVGGDSTLTYDKLKYATLQLQRGAMFIGTNPDVVSPSEEGLIPECGTILAALQAASGIQPIVMGKPEQPLFEMALEVLQLPAERVLMVGDRADTDLLGAQRMNMHHALVTTGVDTEATSLCKGIQPDAVFTGLADLLSCWRDARALCA
jgi:4-nitrophenyl phosphatase